MPSTLSAKMMQDKTGAAVCYAFVTFEFGTYPNCVEQNGHAGPAVMTWSGILSCLHPHHARTLFSTQCCHHLVSGSFISSHIIGHYSTGILNETHFVKIFDWEEIDS